MMKSNIITLIEWALSVEAPSLSGLLRELSRGDPPHSPHPPITAVIHRWRALVPRRFRNQAPRHARFWAEGEGRRRRPRREAGLRLSTKRSKFICPFAQIRPAALMEAERFYKCSNAWRSPE